jgi:hypothetical protein
MSRSSNASSPLAVKSNTIAVVPSLEGDDGTGKHFRERNKRPRVGPALGRFYANGREKAKENAAAS